MNPEHDLNELFDRELRELPLMKAPSSLAPRVMAAVRAKAATAEAPWWLQPWSQWPMYARAALFVAALLIASLFFSGSVVLDDQMRNAPPTGFFSNLPGSVTAYGNTATLLWQKIGQPLFLTRLAVCIAMYLVCIGLVTAMYRVGRERIQ
jgi:hypothetical protein